MPTDHGPPPDFEWLLAAAGEGLLPDAALDAAVAAGVPPDPDDAAQLVEAIGACFADRHAGFVRGIACGHPDPIARASALRVMVRRFGLTGQVRAAILALVADRGADAGLRLTAVQLAGDVAADTPDAALLARLKDMLQGADPEFAEAARAALIAAWTPGWRGLSPAERDGLRRRLSPAAVLALDPSAKE